MVTNCTKSNALNYSMVFWDSVYQKVTKEFPDIKTDMALVDATTMWFVKNPEWFDVIVTGNMFGDIISDLCAQLVGGLGFAASANIGDKFAVLNQPMVAHLAFDAGADLILGTHAHVPQSD
jgi:isocitrate/isopropylmalate dehydrogenase